MARLKISSPFFRAPKKKGFSFFSVGRPRPEPSPKPSCLFSTRKSRSEVPERGDFGEENCRGKGGADRAKKGKKDAQKKVGFDLARKFQSRRAILEFFQSLGA